MSTRFLPLLAFCLVAVGCGGGSSQNGPVLAPPTTFNDITDASDTLFGSLGALDYTPLATLPTSGSATYTGVLEARITDLPDGTMTFTGNLGLLASFADNSLITRATSTALYRDDGTAIPGSLSLETSDFDRQGDPEVDRTLSTSLTGSIAPPGRETIALDLILEGDFFGPNSDYIAGSLLGRAEEDGATGTVTGRFATELD